MGVKECPMCGEPMRVHEHETQDRVLGTAQTRLALSREWLCRECDYFEEVED